MRRYDKFARAVCLVGLETLRPSGAKSFEEILSEINLDIASVKNPDTFISSKSFFTLLEKLAKEWQRPNFALERVLNCDKSLPHLGPIMMLGKFCKTLGEIFELGTRYWAVHTNGFDVILVKNFKVGLSKIYIRYNIMGIRPRQVAEHILANLCVLSRQTSSKPDLKPVSIGLMHQKPENANFGEISDAVFGCPINFGHDRDEIVFQSDVLNLPVAGSMAMFQWILRRYLQIRLNSIGKSESSCSAMVKQAIPNFFGTGNCNFENISELLGYKTKSLQRLLRAEGTNFKELLLETRIETAKSLLSEASISVSEVAEFLDYSTLAPFSSAFRRVTGISPKAFRTKQQLSKTLPEIED